MANDVLPELPELPGMPQLPNADLSGLRFSDQMKLLAPLALGLGGGGRSMDRHQAGDVLNQMNAIGQAYGISKQIDQRNRAVARARARKNDQSVNSAESEGNTKRRQLQGTTNRRSDSAVLRNARDVLGMGTDLYR